MLRLGLRRCRRCEGPIHIKDYKPYCDHCGFQGPYDRAGNPPLPEGPTGDDVSRETPKGMNGPTGGKT